MVTVILNVYKRKEYLKRQIESIKNQTVPVDIWIDFTPQSKEDLSLIDEYPDIKFSIRWNQNLKFHGRFNYALNADTEYIFICDDDILPGKEYLKHCIQTMNDIGDCVLTTFGVCLDPNIDGYRTVKIDGWRSLNKQPVQVDMAGHSWFFKKKYLKYLNYEEPLTRDNGEDLHFSYMVQKYGKIPIIVPTHDEEYPEKLGSEPNISMMMGSDKNATYLKKDHQSLRSMIVKEYKKDGWKTILMK